MVKRLAALVVGMVAVVAVATPASALGIQEHRSAERDQGRKELNLGEDALGKRDWDAAIEHYTKGLDAKACGDNCGNYYFHRGVAFQQKQDCVRAIADFTEALKTIKDNGELYFDASLCHTVLNQEDAALEDLNNAIRVNPAGNNYRVGRCIALFNKRDFAGALPDCEYTLGSAPDDQKMLYATAVSAEQTGDKAKAAKYYRHLLELDHGNQQAADGLKRVGG